MSLMTRTCPTSRIANANLVQFPEHLYFLFDRFLFKYLIPLTPGLSISQLSLIPIRALPLFQ